MAPEHTEPINILMADDDVDDCAMARDALEESRLANNLHVVHDGIELLAYLRVGDGAGDREHPRPGIILLDLNMPRMDGRESLQEIKNDPLLRDIPVLILTTSKAEEDIWRSYDLGANSFISKPVTFNGLVQVMMSLHAYWFEIVALPARRRRAVGV